MVEKTKKDNRRPTMLYAKSPITNLREEEREKKAFPQKVSGMNKAFLLHFSFPFVLPPLSPKLYKKAR